MSDFVHKKKSTSPFLDSSIFGMEDFNITNVVSAVNGNTADGYNTILAIDIKLFTKGTEGKYQGHSVVLMSPITISSQTGNYEFKIQTWGREEQVSTKASEFKKYFYGYSSGKKVKEK